PYKPGAFYFGAATPASIKAINVPTAVVGQPVSVSVSLEVPQGAGRLYYKWGIIDPTTGRFVHTSAEAFAESAPIAITVPADVTSKLVANKLYKFWVYAYAENVPIVTEAVQIFTPRAAAPAPTQTGAAPTATPTAPTPPPAAPAPAPPPPAALTITTAVPAAGAAEALAAGVFGVLAILGALAVALRKRGGRGQEAKTG
ncbi:MAG: peptide-binding protein, partial [Pyrobaculum sp.]